MIMSCVHLRISDIMQLLTLHVLHMLVNYHSKLAPHCVLYRSVVKIAKDESVEIHCIKEYVGWNV
jgi:hypothetical protein